jgi:uncharacterized membrane protein YkvA (DUF1232 family)
MSTEVRCLRVVDVQRHVSVYEVHFDNDDTNYHIMSDSENAAIQSASKIAKAVAPFDIIPDMIMNASQSVIFRLTH